MLVVDWIGRVDDKGLEYGVGLQGSVLKQKLFVNQEFFETNLLAWVSLMVISAFEWLCKITKLSICASEGENKGNT